MKLAIFGATGGTGQELVKQSLAQGHEVTAFARTPEKLALRHERLRVVAGDVLDYAAVEQAVTGQDAVLCALGSPSLKANTVLSEGTQNIIQAMTAHKVRRFVCETSLGVGDSQGQPGFIFSNLVVPLFLRHVMADKEIQESYIKASSLDWVIVRPGGLTNSPRAGNYRHGLAKDISGRIARADVAEFMLKQVSDDTYLRKTPAIAA